MIACFRLVLVVLVLGLSGGQAWGQGQLIQGHRTLVGGLNACTAGGSANAFTCALPYPLPAYVARQCFTFLANHTITGSATLNVDGRGTRVIKKFTSEGIVDLGANDILNGEFVTVCYDGTNMQKMGRGGEASSVLVYAEGLLKVGDAIRTASTEPEFVTLGTVDLIDGGGAGGKMQVRTDGSLEYTDAATPSVRRRGFLLPYPLVYNLDIADCHTDGNGGKVTFTALGEMVCAADQGGAAGSGDISAVGNISSGDAGTTGFPFTSLWYSGIAAPSAPAAGQGRVFFDQTAKNACVIADDSAIKCGAQVIAETEHFFLTAFAADGAFAAARPSIATLSDAASVVQLTAAQRVIGKQIVPRVCQLSATSGSLTPNADTCDIVHRHDVAGQIDMQDPTATGSNPATMQPLTFSFRAASAQTITWTSGYAAGYGGALPSTLPEGQYVAISFRYNSTSTKWEYWASTDDDLEVSSLLVQGSTSGVITIIGDDEAGTYSFILPTSPGTSGQPLLSGGGAGPQTYATLGVAGGGTGATTLTGVVRGNGTSAQTAAELSGAVSTSGSNVTVMSAPFRVKSCVLTIGNTGAAEPALASDTDENDACLNDFGVVWTITAVACKADTTTGTPTADVKQTTTEGSSILTGAISCGTSWTAGTLSGTPTVNAFSGSGNATCSSAPCNLAVDLTPGGTAKRITVKIVGTIPAS